MGSGNATGRHRTGRSRRARRWWRIALALLALAAAAKVAHDVATLPDASSIASGPPPITALMRWREAEAARAGKPRRRRQRVVPLQQIAPVAVSAVVLSEDSGFFAHGGIEPKEIEAAIDRAIETGKLRGASTITQQLAKNLWLSTERSVTRKLKELVLARRLEQALPKRRILWLYLNVAEWGDGVYGIDAAAREHFQVSAAELSVAQGAMLAAMLPAPRTWLPEKRPEALYRRAAACLDNLEAVGKISAEQAAAARAELDTFFGRASAAAPDPPGAPEEGAGASAEAP